MNSELTSQFDTARLWREEAKALRKVLLESGLTEERKWGKPCYTHDGANVAIIQRMKDFLALMFFKGGLLKDPGGMLEAQGPNSRAGYRLRFTSVAEVTDRTQAVKTLVKQAIAAEKGGLKIEKADAPELPEELVHRFVEDTELREAFEALTPGRQRSWSLHFSQAKQSATRIARIDKAREKILAGKGWNER